MSAFRRGVLGSLLIALAGCGSERTPARAPAARPAPPLQPPAAAQRAPVVPAERWLVPYFSPLTVDDDWSPDGALTVARTHDGELFLYRAATAAPVWLLPFPANVYHPVWSPDGRLLAGLSREHLVVIDVEKRTRVADLRAPPPFEGSGRPALLAGFLPGSRSVAVVGPDGEVRTVDLADGTVQSSGLTDVSVFGKALLAPGKSWLAYTSNAGGLAIFDLVRHERIFSDPRPLRPMAWFSAGDRLVATSRDFSVVIQPGQGTLELPISGEPIWNGSGTQLAFTGRERCRGCLRPFGPDSVFALGTGREVRSDDFAPDGARFGATNDGLQDRTTGALRPGLPPVLAPEQARSLFFEDDHTLVFDAQGWAARIDLSAARVLAQTDDMPGVVHASLNLIVSCADDRFVVRERFGGATLGTLARPCHGAALRPLKPPLFAYEVDTGAGKQSEVVDLRDGEALARLTPRNFASWDEPLFWAASGDARQATCQLFDAGSRTFSESAPFPADALRAACTSLAPGVIVARAYAPYAPSNTYVWLAGRGFLAPDGSVTRSARPFCGDAWLLASGVACSERASRAQNLRLYVPGQPLRKLTVPSVARLVWLVASRGAKRVAFVADHQAFVGDFATGKITPWGPRDFVPRRFRDDLTLEGDIARLASNGVVEKILRNTIVRDGVELPTPELALAPDLPAGFGDWGEYRRSPSGRVGVRMATPLTMLRFADQRILRLLVARLDGTVHVAALDEQGQYAGDRELTRRFLYVQGTTPRDAVLVTSDGDQAAPPEYRADLLQEFLSGRH